MKIFFDANIFMHFRCIDELALSEILNLGKIDLEIVFPDITIRELNRHKDKPENRKKRERAASILKKIKVWIHEGTIRPGLNAEYYGKFPQIDFSEHGLSRELPDHLLIATILQYKLDNPDCEIILVSDDAGLHLNSLKRGFTLAELPENYRLPDEPDESQKRIRTLETEIANLKNVYPAVDILFIQSNEKKIKVIIHNENQREDVESNISDELTLIKVELPYLIPPVKNDSGINPKLMASGEFLKQVTFQEYERYNQQLNDYYEAYELFLRAEIQVKLAKARSFMFSFLIVNSGRTPAENVDVTFTFPEGLQVFDDDFPIKLQEKPTPPNKPQSQYQKIFRAYDREVFRPNYNDFHSDVEAPTECSRIEHDGGKTKLFIRIARVKHGEEYMTKEIGVLFNSPETIHSFNCDYSIRPDNLPQPVQGTLHFIIEKA